jgi:hypothetical protein
MELRCSDGILALVIHDTVACRTNIGRVVQVRAPIRFNPDLGLLCWLIKPVILAPYFVETRGRVRQQVLYWKTRVEHPDAWLLPLQNPEISLADLAAKEDPQCIAPVDWDFALATALRKWSIDLRNGCPNCAFPQLGEPSEGKTL